MKNLFAKISIITLLVTLVAGGLPIQANAAFNASFNPEINYQGRLVDNSNVAVVDGTYNMRFNLYTTASGGVSLWTETLVGSNRVSVASGLFSVMLGSTTPLTSVDFNQTLYLGVEIGGTAGVPTWDGEMTPRKIIGAVPAAIVSDTLDGLDSTQFARTDATSTIRTSSAQTILTINQTGAGNVLDVQRNGSSAFLVDSTGNVTLGGTLTSGTVNGQTISSAANFSGTITATGGLTTLSNLLLTGSSTLKNFTSQNSTSSQATSTNLFSTTGTFTTVCLTGDTCRTTWPSGSGTGGNSKWATSTNSDITPNGGGGIMVFASSTITDLNVARSTTTNATSTNSFATTASSTNLFSTSLFTGLVTAGAVNGQTISSAANFTGTLTATGGLTSLSNLTLSGSTTLQNFTGLNNTTTNATTTNHFSTTSSSTNLFATSLYGGTINGFGLSMCNGASESLIWSGGVFGCHTVAGGGGGGSAAGTWSTTTSQVVGEFINYPNNSSDVVVIGSSASTSAKFFFDPNTSFGKLAADILITGSTTLQNFTGTNNTTTNATTTAHFSTTASSTNLFSTSLNTGLITSGLVNSQTISSAANFTGTVTATGGLTSLSNLLLSGSSTLLSFTGQNNTTTNATTTTIFSTTASSTNLFSTSLNTGAITSSLINGQTISSTANFTGTLTATGGLTSLSNLTLSGSSTLQNFTFVNATGTSGTTTNLFTTTSSSTNIFGTNLTVAGTGLVVDSTNKRVGVGIAAPETTLHVFNDASSLAQFRLGRTGASTGYLQWDNNGNDFYLGNNFSGSDADIIIQPGTGNPAVTVKGWGAVGIGTTTPRWLLDLATSTAPQLTLTDGITANHWSFRNAGGQFYLATSSPTTFATSSVSILSIDSNGVVTLANHLVVSGNSTTTNATTTNLFSTTASTSNLYIAVGPCSGTNALNVSGGKVTCGAVSGSGSASSTLLSDNNAFSGLNTFTDLASVTRSTTTNATTTNLFSTTESSTNLFSSTMKIGSNALTVNSSGNVGIGLASATFKLDVSGNINFASDKSIYQGGVKVLDASSTNSTTLLGLLAGNANAFDGSFNTFLGYQAGTLVTTADNNTFVGYASGQGNTTAANNTGVGSQSLYNTTSGGSNAAFGYNSLFANITGTNNVAVGYQASFNNASATSTTALGYGAAAGTGTFNAQQLTAVGTEALASITTGASGNTALGYRAGFGLLAGARNILLGYQAGDALTTGSQNIVIGYDIDAPAVSSSNILDIGNLIYGTAIDGSGTTLSSGNIGIGTSTPPSRLTISPTQTLVAASPTLLIGTSSLVSAGAGGTYFGINAPINTAEYLNFQRNGSTVFKFSDGGDGTAAAIQIGNSAEGGINVLGNGISVINPSPGGATVGGFVTINTSGVWLDGGTYTQNLFNVAGNYAPTGNVSTSIAGLNVNTTINTDNASVLTAGQYIGANIAPTIGGGLLTYKSSSPMAGLKVAPIINVNTFSKGYTALLVNPTETSVSATSSNYIADFQVGGSSRMVITPGGQVGIGTTTPRWALDIASSTRAQLTLSDASLTSDQWSFRNAGGNLYVATSSASTFATSSASALTVNSSGSLGVGTTSPWKTFSVSGTAALKGLTATGAGDVQLCLSTNNEVTTGATCGTSSLRFKHDIQTLTANLDEVLKFHPVSFVYNGYTDPKVGFIAEEVNQIDPRLVFYDDDGVTPRGVLYDNFAPLLAGAIQDLNNKIDALAASTTAALANLSLPVDLTHGLTVQGGLTIDSLSSASDLIVLQSDAEFVGRPYFNSDTGGLAVIEAGSRKVDVTFDRPYIDAPVVSATMTLDASTTDMDRDAVIMQGNTYVVTGRSINGFSIMLDKPADKQVMFSWIALAINNMRTVSSASTTQPILSTVTDLTGDNSNTGNPIVTPPVDTSSTTPVYSASSTEPIVTTDATSTATGTPTN